MPNNLEISFEWRGVRLIQVELTNICTVFRLSRVRLRPVSLYMLCKYGLFGVA